MPAEMQGRDLQPLLAGLGVPWRDEWYYEHTFTTRPPRPPIARSEGVRTTRWKYIRYVGQDPPYEQLFDLANDAGEKRNLAGVKGHENALSALRERWRRLREEAR